MIDMKWLPGGRYIYYGGRPANFYNNCLLFKGEEDTREEWARLAKNSTAALMSGAGIGTDYSVFRPKGSPLSRTGGQASGPIPLMSMINEIGRNVMQGGSRRSAIYASLNWQHPDAHDFLHMKDWHTMMIGGGFSIADAKAANFNYPAPLDMTNVSLNYDNAWRDGDRLTETFLVNCMQACRTGEPGFSFNFDEKENETLRNACTEVTSADDSDVCNLASINMANISTLDEFRDVVASVARFLVCGTLRADLPYEKVYTIREKNRRLGLGLMGVHEWLLKRGYSYEPNEELAEWLQVWQDESTKAANSLCDTLGISKPVGFRAVAPTGSIGMLAGTTTGIEPLYAVAFKRRYLTGDKTWNYEYVVDGTAKHLIEQGINPDSIETSLDLAADPERRLAFQAFVQGYTDHAISSTINLPAWGTELNNEDTVKDFAKMLAKYAPQLRGFTVYPDGARGGQPLTSVPYYEAHNQVGQVFTEEFVDVCDITGKGGTCGA